jgi:hypothetical protein
LNNSPISLGFSTEKLAFINDISKFIHLSDNTPKLFTVNMLLSVEFQVLYLFLIIAMLVFFELIKKSCVLFYFRNTKRTEFLPSF